MSYKTRTFAAAVAALLLIASPAHARTISIVGVVNDSGSTDKRTAAQVFVIPAGETGQINIAVTHAAGTAYDLTGAQLLLAVNGTTISRQATINSPATLGTAYFPLVIADTLGMRGVYTYDVWLTDSNGNRWEVVPPSNFTVTPAQGQPGQAVTVPSSQQPLAQGPQGIGFSAPSTAGAIPFDTGTAYSKTTAPTQAQGLVYNGTAWTPLTERYNVKAYGAKGDGASDDTAAIASAISAANGIGEVFFPPGTYIVKGLTVSIDHTRLVGSRAATLRMPVEATGTGTPIIISAANYLEVRGLSFDGQRASQPADGFSDSFSQGLAVGVGKGRSYRGAIVSNPSSASPLSGLTVDGCSFQNFFGAPIATQNVNLITITNDYFNNNNFESGFLSNTYTNGVTYMTNILVANTITLNAFSGDVGGVNANGWLIHQAQSVVFTGNQIDSLERDCLKLESSREATITGNTCRHVFLAGANYPAIALQSDAIDIVVDGNKMYDVPAGVNVNGGSFTAVGFTNVSITNNIIDNVHGTAINDGIELVGRAGFPVSGFHVSGNTITGVQRYGIYLDLGTATANDLQVNGNTITTTGTSGSAGIYTVMTTNASAGIHIAANHINMGNVASQGGIRFDCTSGGTLSGVNIAGNTILTGAAHAAVTATSGCFTGSSRMTGTITDGLTSTMAAAGITLGDSTFNDAVTFTGATFSATPTGALTLTAGSSSTWNTNGGTVDATNFDTSSGVLMHVGPTNATGVVLSSASGNFYSAADIMQFSTLDATGKTINIATSATDTAGQALTLRAGGAGAASTVGALSGGAVNIFSSAGNNATATLAAGQAGAINIQPTSSGNGAVGQAPANGTTVSILGGNAGADGGSGLNANGGGISIQSGTPTNSGVNGAISLGTTRGAVTIGNTTDTTVFTSGSSVRVTGVTFTGSATFSSSQTLAALVLSNSSAQIDTSGANLLGLGTGTATGVVLSKSGGTTFTAADTIQFSTTTAATAKNISIATVGVDTAGNSLTLRAGGAGAASAVGGGTGGSWNGIGGAGGAASTSFAAGGGGGWNGTAGQGGSGAVGHGPGAGGAWIGTGGSAGADGGSGIAANGGSVQLNGGAAVNGGTDGATFLANSRGALNLSRSGGTVGFFGATAVAQQSTTGTTAGFTAGAGTTATSASTYNGNTGTSAYTVGDIVLALKHYGLLAN